MAHDHEHHHHHHEVSGKNLFITIILNLVITVSQVIGGLFSGSLALLSDALHNFSDVMALIISYLANRISKKEATDTRTFGYKRAEILAALFNATVLIIIGFYLIIQAYDKFITPQPIESSVVIWLALLSILLNWLSVVLIKEDAHNNMNIKSAYLHLLTDVMTSVAVLVGGVAIYLWNVYWIDSLITVVIAFYLINSSFGIIKEASGVLMQFAPTGIELGDIVAQADKFEEIENIHHIHMWRLNDKSVFLEAHIDFKRDLRLSETMKILDELEHNLKHLGFTHITLQQEFERDDCKKEIHN